MCESLQLIRAADPLWGDWLRRTEHDFYHGSAYHSFLEQQGYGEAWLAIAGSKERFVAWPYLLRPLGGAASPETGLQDISSVDGYAGPVTFGCTPGDSFSDSAVRMLLSHWKARGIVSVFCRFHPLLENHRWVESLGVAGPGEFGDGEQSSTLVKLEGHTVSIDLTLTDDDAFSQYRETHRRHIHRARRLNLVTQSDCKFERLADFMRLYHGTMRRNRAAEQYFYPVDFVEGLRQALEPALSLHVADLGPRAAAAVLVSEYRGIVQYLFGGVEEDLYNFSPLKLLLEDVRSWARLRKNRVLHLGGGRGGHEDSLFYFKAGFSGRRHAFYTGRWVLNPDQYCQARQQRVQKARDLGKKLDPAFFPAYRAPFID